MEILRWKARLTVLWVFLAVGMSAAMLISFMTPGTLDEIMAGKMGGSPLSEEMMVCYALFWLVPLVLAVLCLTLGNSRLLNFILGILFGIFFIFDKNGR